MFCQRYIEQECLVQLIELIDFLNVSAVSINKKLK